MSCTVTVDGPCQRTLSFSVERSVLDQEIDGAVAALAQRTHVKGFRPGKAPRDLIRRTHGASVTEDARKQVMARAFSEAVKEHELRPVGDPVMNLEVYEDDGKGPFTFALEVEVAPEFELAVPDPLAVTVVLPPVGDSMIEGEVLRLREQAGSLQDIDDGSPIGDDDIVDATIVYEIDGHAMEPRNERPILVRHDLVDGIRHEGLKELIVGKVQGDTIELEAELPAHFAPAEHAGKSAQLTVTLDRHRRLVPAEVDETFLERYQVASLDEMKERIQEALDAQRAQFRDQQTDREIEQQLLEAHEFELPERLLAKQIDHRVHEHAHKLMEQQGLDSEAGHQQAEAERERITEGAQRGLRLAFVLDALARAHDLTADENAAVEQVRMMARQQQQDENEVLTQAIREGWIHDVIEQLTRDAARAWLREKAQIEERAPTPDDAATEG